MQEKVFENFRLLIRNKVKEKNQKEMEVEKHKRELERLSQEVKNLKEEVLTLVRLEGILLDSDLFEIAE